MTQQEKIKILKKIEDKYKKQPGVLGVVAFGSFVRGDFDSYSDIDVYVLKAKKPFHARESYMLKNIRVDVTIDGKKDADRFLKQERRSVRRIFSHMLANGHILYEKENSLKVLQRVAVRNLKERTTYGRDEMLMHLYSIEDFYGEVLRFSKSKDKFSFEQNIALLVNNAIECFLKIKGEYMRRPNELEAIIKKEDPSFWKSLEAIYLSESDFDKVRNLKGLVKRVGILARGPLPQRWTVH